MQRTNANLNLSSLIENLPVGVVVHEMDTSICYANEEALQLLRLEWDQVIGKTAFDSQWHLIGEDGKTLSVEEYPVNKTIRSGENLQEYVVGIVDTESEKPTWVLTNTYIDVTEDEKRVVVTFNDVTKQFELPFKEIVDNARDAVVVTEAGEIDDPSGPKIVYVNQLFCDFTGYTKEEVLGSTPRKLQGDETDRASLDRIRIALEKQEPVRETLINYSKNGKPYWLDISIFPLHMHGGDKVTHFAAIERDVSESKKRELEHQDASLRDPLTRLLNRRGFDLAVQKMLKDSSYVILAQDLDFFKKINDTYGHNSGDKVLELVSKVLLENSRGGDLCARFGGEEFIVLLPNTPVKNALNVAERIRKTIEETNIVLEDHEIKCTISIGMAESKEGESMEVTMHKADEALYKAKESGRNKVVVSEG